LSFLAQHDPARSVLGTFRPVEASTHDHPIREVTDAARVAAVSTRADYLSTAEFGHRTRPGDRSRSGTADTPAHDGNPLAAACR
jgi:hypothetical protein